MQLLPKGISVTQVDMYLLEVLDVVCCTISMMIDTNENIYTNVTSIALQPTMLQHDQVLAA